MMKRFTILKENKGSIIYKIKGKTIYIYIIIYIKTMLFFEIVCQNSIFIRSNSS